MSNETIIVLAVILLAFLGFMGALAWADRRASKTWQDL